MPGDGSGWVVGIPGSIGARPVDDAFAREQGLLFKPSPTSNDEELPSCSPKPTSCPSCHKNMISLNSTSKHGSALYIDICPTCMLLWFDKGEAPALSSESTLMIYSDIISRSNDPKTPPNLSMSCPSCAIPLAQINDFSKAGRFVYMRCDSCLGRAIFFTQFLIEKSFIRQLNNSEILKVSAKIGRISCAGCGSSIDIKTQQVCPRCKTPISILDEQAAKNAVRFYLDATKKNQELLSNAPTIAAAEIILSKERAAFDAQMNTWKRNSTSHVIDETKPLGLGSLALSAAAVIWAALSE